MSTHIYSSIGLQKYILKEDRISAEYILEYRIEEDRKSAALRLVSPLGPALPLLSFLKMIGI